METNTSRYSSAGYREADKGANYNHFFSPLASFALGPLGLENLSAFITRHRELIIFIA
jgi:hypothetical protein